MNKKDLENLEIILNKICENNQSVFYKFFQDKKGVVFGIEDDDEAENYFIKLTFEFEKAGIAYYDRNSFVLVPKENECLKFKENGGFYEFYKENKKIVVNKIRKETQEEIIRKETISEFEYKKYGFYVAVVVALIALLSWLTQGN